VIGGKVFSRDQVAAINKLVAEARPPLESLVELFNKAPSA
jgi:hypothetical protein